MKGDSKGDFTRLTFNELKHYSGVQMQQGRVQLDADWNEEIDIIDHRWRATLEDAVGPTGAPKVAGGFLVDQISGSGGPDLSLSPGRIYVDGILCELDAPFLDGTVVDSSTVSMVKTQAGETALAAGLWVEVADPTGTVLTQAQISGIDLTVTPAAVSLQNIGPGTLPATKSPVQVRQLVTYQTQPDLPSPTPIDNTPRPNSYYGNTYVAYLDVFERLVTALDDPNIREVALNGPDTGTRTKTTWQVRLAKMPDLAQCKDVKLPVAPPPETADAFPLPVSSTGVMQARAVPTADPQTDCLLPAEAGYRRLENQLYRVEIHVPGLRKDARFKWSRDNGAIAYPWTGITPDSQQITFKGAPQNSGEGFASGQWVELTDETHDLSPDGSVLGTFVQLLGTPVDDQTLSIDPTTTTGSLAFIDFPRHPKLRRWESGLIPVDQAGDANGWLSLEDGVEVRFPDTGGWFNRGDYWLIPARTATTDIEWPTDPAEGPLAQPPRGVEHRYCALGMVQVHSGGVLTTLDCRPLFPALTDIAATDVNYDNNNCGLVNANNVQEALDALCRRNDLKHHNKLIHGWGIVGGLQVECNAGTGPLWVMVRNGYAVDCNGNDIEIDDTPVDMGQVMLPLQNPLDSNNDGEISLIIGLDQNGQVQITGEKYVPPSSEFDEIFNGTLLMDVVDDCVKPFQLFMAAELAKPAFANNPPVSGAEELGSAFVNLLSQAANSQGGQNVYISSAEHNVLNTFYSDLRAWLTSDTFCGLFSSVRDYPQAAADGQLPHAFGTGQQTRIKYRPNTNEYYTIANGVDPTRTAPQLNRFNADTGAIMAELDPTGGTTTGPIRDFTFSPDGTTIYVIMDDPDRVGSIYRSGTITATGVTWVPGLVNLTGARLTSMEAFQAGATPKLVAVGEGSGVFILDPATLSGFVAIQAKYPCNAFAQMAYIDAWPNAAFLAVPFNSDARATPTTYNFLKVFEIFQGVDSFHRDVPLSESGSDGAAWGGVWALNLYVVVGSGPKTITGYNWFDGFTNPIKDANQRPMAVTVDDCAIRLATGWTKQSGQPLLFWASQDFYTLKLVDATTQLAVSGWTLPTQVGPFDVASAPWRSELAVLHRPSDSVLRVGGMFFNTDATTAQATGTLMTNSVNYHAQAVEAYVDLLAGFLQYLKDCFCHHLLVKTNSCSPASQKLYLGCVSVRNAKVYNVCNFSGRHYLKTFPTIGYWLSLFPLVPMISELIELFCCFIIPDAAAKYTVPGYHKPPSGSSPQWSLQSFFSTMREIQNLNVRKNLNQLLQQFGLAKHVVAYSAGFRSMAAPATSGTTAIAIGQNPATAQGALSQAGMTSQVKAFTPSLGPQLITNMVDIFRPPVSPTGPVTLNAVGGQVLFTSNAPVQAGTQAVAQPVQAPTATQSSTPTLVSTAVPLPRGVSQTPFQSPGPPPQGSVQTLLQATQGQTPGAGQVQAPTTGQVQAPTTGQVQAPTTGQVEAPTTGQVQAPTTGQVQAPTTDQVQAPTTGQVQAPSTGQITAPTTLDLHQQLLAKDVQIQQMQAQLTTMSQQITDLHASVQQLAGTQSPQAPSAARRQRPKPGK